MSSPELAEEARIAYRTVGTGPPDLLLVHVHGWAGTSEYFDETVARLDLAHVRVTSVDLPGHGGSHPQEGEWTLESIDDAILAAADAVGAARFVALGFSMSGKFVQHLAVRNPDRVAALVLVAGTQASSLAFPSELLEDWYGRAGSAERIEELVRPFLTGPVDEGALARFCANAARIDRPSLEGSMRMTIEADFAERLGAVAVPTLVVAGARDEMFPVDMLRVEIADRIPRARLAVLEDVGHEIPLERPGEMAALIEAFLAGLES
jgi:pimeloyl-ACP methyl ester carboxylesterase